MNIKLRFLALGLVTLLGFMLASSQRISAYQVTTAASSAPSGPALLGEGGGSSSGDVIPPVCLWECFTYLPVVVNIPGGISGHITQGGAPVGGISLELCRDDGSNVSHPAATTTDSSGYYKFTDVPSLGSGQSYSICYDNPERNDSRLASWSSRSISSYLSGASVDLGTNDIADIPLVAPGPGDVITLPYLFQWTLRPATPSDIYLLAIFDPVDVDPFWSAFAGYGSSASVSSLSSKFGAGVQYAWCMAVWDANNGIGISYYYRLVSFTNTGNSVASPLTTSLGSRDLLLKRLRSSHPQKQ